MRRKKGKPRSLKYKLFEELGGVYAKDLMSQGLVHRLILLRSSKADQRSNTITLIISEQKGSESDICPVKRLKQFLVMRYSGPTCSSPVYIHFDGSNLTRYQFNSVLLKTLQFCGLSEHIRSHSFRIGGTSELARRGVTESEIKRWGRWNSNAYSSYIQLSFLE
jgi:hypothetical protein